MSTLLTRFPPLLDNHPDAPGLCVELLDRWGEPHRVYHSTEHLRTMLAHLDELGGHSADPVAVELATWFHDAVYDPAADDNEERSAQLAEERLPAVDCPPERTAETARLVRLTATHAPAAGDTNGEAVCDADLAVLAAGPEEYAHYAAAVRREYATVPTPAFRAGRAAVLRQLLALPSLYRTPYGAEHWETAARHNLRAELELLQVAEPPP
jgi:predicted metal-dependent HD superfamily phosphohydrolase